ncbi:mechanosensitive ion channel [Catenovulum sp. 2E275]|uniref:mechanosensitive ion channel family protein n=1 Tax=Catenovulum sp. 2E275 TaxID=2980497 RepID=UPI0021D12624|nr:mechanosensitive ion channel domain-containing protein [Catenovulum sp. 2E275]MCU4677663.1 mechanosensitive ion channel [Catenovulum sp. 2E275]
METIINFFAENQPQLIVVAKNTLLTIFILIVAIIGAKILRRAVHNGVYRLSKQDEIITKLLTTLSGYIVYLIALVIILDLFGVNTASLVALVGAAGLAIGLALKDTLRNIAAGVMLLFLKPLKKIRIYRSIWLLWKRCRFRVIYNSVGNRGWNFCIYS